MADFLAGLSARALGVAPIARPRVPALFESSPDARAPQQAAPMEADAVETNTRRINAPADRTASGDTTPPAVAVSSPANRASPVSQSAMQPVAPAAVGAAAAVAMDARGSREATPLRPDVFPPPNDRESEFQAPRQLAPAPIVAAETTREPVSPPNGAGVPSREPSLPPIAAAVALHGRDADGELGGSSRETRPAVATVVARADEAIASPHSADTPFALPVAPAERGPTRMEARDRLSRGARYGDRQAAEQAPVIRVTIGRVEVRAVMPAPPPASRQAPRSSLVSLDDYLKSPDRN
jgi:hypothetical protein